jgi:hypothetical protein
MTASKLAGFTNVHALLEAERAELGGFAIAVSAGFNPSA